MSNVNISICAQLNVSNNDFEHACVPQHHHNFEKINLLWLELLVTNLIVLTSNLFVATFYKGIFMTGQTLLLYLPPFSEI